jgi:hypothetical protein
MENCSSINLEKERLVVYKAPMYKKFGDLNLSHKKGSHLQEMREETGGGLREEEIE